MEALMQYDSSDSSEHCESYDDDDQPGKRQNAMNRSDDLNFKTRTDPASEACNQKAAELEVDFFGLVSEDDTDATASACKDIIYRSAKVAEKPGSLSANVSISADVGDGSPVLVPDTAFWKGEVSIKPIVDYSETPTTEHTPIHSRHQQTLSCKRPAAVVDSQNNCEQHYGYKRKHSKTELNQSNPTSENREAMPSQCRYTVHHKIGPHLNQKYVNRVPRRKMTDISAHGGIVNKIEWCRPEFSHLLLSASMDRTVKVWDVLSATPTCVQTLRFHEKAVKDATWSASGREILSAGYDRTARICDVEKGVTTSCCCHDNFVTSVKWHPVNHNLFVSGSQNVIKCWDKRNTSRPARIFKYKEPFGQVQDLVFLRDGSEFLCCTDLVARDSADRSIMAWHFDSGVVLSNQIFQERYTCTRLRLHPSEAQFVAQTHGGYITLFSTIKPYKMNKCKRFDSHQVLGHSIGCDFSPDGQLLASGSSDGSLVVYDFHRARKVTALPHPETVCLDVAWHPVLSSVVAATSDDGNISVWH